MITRCSGRFLSWAFWLIALHSFFVGLILFFNLSCLHSIFGPYLVEEFFFSEQCGVFHFVMAAIYTIIAADFDRSRSLIFFAIYVKFCAAVFLTHYFFFVNQIWVTLFCGLVDLFMGVGILTVYRFCRGKDVRFD